MTEKIKSVVPAPTLTVVAAPAVHATQAVVPAIPVAAAAPVAETK